MRNDSAPPARLDTAQQLGWSTWLGGSEAAASRRGSQAQAGQPAALTGTTGTAAASVSGHDECDYAVGMVFEPEQCIAMQGAAHSAFA